MSAPMSGNVGILHHRQDESAAPAPAAVRQAEAMSEDWRRWEGEIVNALFPLLRLVNASDHSAVFLTEGAAHEPAAIKLIPADRTLTATQLSHWRTAGALSHPHLLRLVDAGRCELGVRPYLFVVMEYAEETLAQILPQRPLTADEVREMLLPTLEALSFLHRKNLVQGGLKPPNVLVVNDRLKLASDTIRPAGTAGAPTAGFIRSSVYDPPEARDGRSTPAGDIWSLGVTLVEALTQGTPVWTEERAEIASVPATIPPAFAQLVQRCLSHDPARRPTASELEAELKRPPPGSVAVPRPVEPVARQAPEAASPRRPLPRLAVVAVALVMLLAVWTGLRLSRSTPAGSRQAAASAPAVSHNPQTAPASPPAVAAPSQAAPWPPPPAVVAPSQAAPSRPLATGASPAVLHEQIPDVPRSARATIHGRIKVAVRVSVDASGTVVGATLDNPGPSRYFARLASEAARKWRFTPADNANTHQWLLRFEFARDGTTAHATPRR